MEGESPSTDRLEQRVAADEHLIARIRARQMRDLAELDRRQVATADGSRSLAEWTASRLDVGLDTARTLVRTMRRIQDRLDLKKDLASGELTFDRVEALSRVSPETGLMMHANVGAVRREAAKQARISAEAEYRSARDQFMVLQPTLDESCWKLWGGLDGPAGALVDKVLTEAADALPDEDQGDLG